MRCRLLTWMWAGQRRRGKDTRSAAVRVSLSINAVNMLSKVRFLQGGVYTAVLRDAWAVDRCEALHAHLVQR
jgi:hypothetical protein